jgi:hypothetical protein
LGKGQDGAGSGDKTEIKKQPGCIAVKLLHFAALQPGHILIIWSPSDHLERNTSVFAFRYAR